MGFIEQYGERIGSRLMMRVGVGLGVVGCLLVLTNARCRQALLGVGDDGPAWAVPAFTPYRAPDGRWGASFPGKPTIRQQQSGSMNLEVTEYLGADDAAFRVAWVAEPSDAPARPEDLPRYCESKIFAATLPHVRRAGSITGRTFGATGGEVVRCRSELTTTFKRADGKTAEGRGLLLIVHTADRRYEVSLVLSSQLASRRDLDAFVDGFAVL